MKYQHIGSFIISIGLLFAVAMIPLGKVMADDCDTANLGSCNEDCLKTKLEKCTSALSSMEAAKKPHVENLRKMDADIAAFQARIKAIEFEVGKKAAAIAEGEKELTGMLLLANKRIRQFYIRAAQVDFPLLTVIASRDMGEALRTMGYNRSVTNEDKKVITQTAVLVRQLLDRKIALEAERVSLSALKTDIDRKAESVRKLVAEANAYQAKLSTMIAAISARQQELLAQKLASLNIPKSAYNMQGGCVDDRNIDPGFSPRFAFFTFGVPNRIGLNQYGAKGRAEAGQSTKDILAAYYNADYTTGYNQGITIHVVGKNEYGQSFDDRWNIEEYVKHIYEMPTAWDQKALQAQAIAARSYALAVTNNGANSICPSQSCQVVKREENDDRWKQAVRDTAGIVLTSGGQPIKAWFSSTHGGYVFTSQDIGWNATGWTKRMTDTNGSIGSISDLMDRAYDRASPWFYCDWGSRAQYNKTAWLKPDEVADIVNVLLLAKADSGTQKHLSQPDKPNPDGVETWSADKVRSELRSRGGSPFGSVSQVLVDWDKATGRVLSVGISGDGGSVTLAGDEFKTYFNLRAPANIQIVGPLYNVEKK